jgi:hypothetical protein
MVRRGVERDEAGVLAGQGLEELRWQDDEQRVLAGGAAIARRPVLQQRAHPERTPGAHPLDQSPGLVDDVHRPGADHVQPQPLLADADHEGAPPGITQSALRRDRVQDVRRQRVERRVLRQEVANLRKLHVHAAIVPPPDMTVAGC